MRNRNEFEQLRLNLKRHLGEEAFDKGWPETQGKVPKFRYDEQWKADFEKWKTEYLKQITGSKGPDYLSSVPRNEWEDWIKNNSSIATAFVLEMKGRGLSLDFSEQSLYKLDKHIGKAGWIKNGLSIELVKKLGAYVTQTIMSRNDSKWFFDHLDELPSLVIGDIHVSPLARVLKVVEQGEKFGQWYSTIEKMVLGLTTGKPSRETGRMVK